VLALDIPSGLHSDRGVPLPTAVVADATVTFIGKKLGLYTGAALDHTGPVHYADLDVPREIFDKVTPMGRVIQPTTLVRASDSHKGSYGRLLVLGGNTGMGGAATMAGMAALRCGAGLVRIATHPDHALTIGNAWPELMVEGVDDRQVTRHWIKQATALVLGPGLGQDEWSRQLSAAVMESTLPCVIDADGLTLLGDERDENPDRVLTPHPGEAAGLLGITTAEVQADRYSAVNRLHEKFGGVVVLKGAGSLVACDDGTWLCDRGNPGMATAGMGDVLSGVIGGLLGQGLSAADAARTGVWIHSAAGDLAADEVGEPGLVATDLLPWISLLADADTEA
jgi:NAD(P)H-hydrate epimerase